MARGLLGPVQIIPGTTNNMTGTAVLTSKVLRPQILGSVAIQAVWVGTANGTFSIQGSTTVTFFADGTVKDAGTWDDLGVVIGPAAGTSSHGSADLSITGYPFIRVVYTNTSGTGTLTVTATAKGI